LTQGMLLTYCNYLGPVPLILFRRDTDMAAKTTELLVLLKADGPDLVLIYDGVKIAKRGQPGSPQAGQWVSLEPGYTVYSSGPEMVVEYNGVRLHTR
jgi:hypothetical protein